VHRGLKNWVHGQGKKESQPQEKKRPLWTEHNTRRGKGRDTKKGVVCWSLGGLLLYKKTLPCVKNKTNIREKLARKKELHLKPMAKDENLSDQEQGCTRSWGKNKKTGGAQQAGWGIALQD